MTDSCLTCEHYKKEPCVRDYEILTDPCKHFKKALEETNLRTEKK